MWPVEVHQCQCNFSIVASKLEDFSRSQAVTNIVKVVISRKLCNVETMLLQIVTGRNNLSHRAISDDIECPTRSLTYCRPFKCDSLNSCPTVYKISSNIARTAVHLRQLSCLLCIMTTKTGRHN